MGTREFLVCVLLPLWDHPHACGDKKVACSALSADTGSSPRVWGQAETFQRQKAERRIIPTRVGTSVLGIIDGLLGTNHPHACGDKCQYPHCREPSLGSSPRVWGQVSISALPRAIFRIIPTRVGTRIHQRAYAAVFQDHPHACGDKFRIMGSHFNDGGIIPTRVGTRSYRVLFAHLSMDHPHACGDKYNFRRRNHAV